MCTTVYPHCVSPQVADEVEMIEYQKRREEWTRRQENRRHQFTISHPTPASSDEVCRSSLLTNEEGYMVVVMG